MPKNKRHSVYALATPDGTIQPLPEGTSREEAVQIGRANHDSGVALGELVDGAWLLMDLGGDWGRPELDEWEPPADLDPLSAAALELDRP